MQTAERQTTVAVVGLQPEDVYDTPNTPNTPNRLPNFVTNGNSDINFTLIFKTRIELRIVGSGKTSTGRASRRVARVTTVL